MQVQIQGYNGIPDGGKRASTNDVSVREDAPVEQPNAGVESEQTSSADSVTDTVDISDNARKLIAAQQQPPSSDDTQTVEHVRQFLQNKLYNDQGLLEETAAKLAPILYTEA